MQFFGISIGDWTALITSVAAVASFVMWLYKKAIAEPAEKRNRDMAEQMNRNNKELTDQIKALSRTINKLGNNTEGLDRRVDKHGEVLTNHEDRIEDLENKNHITRRTKHGKNID